jgi:dTMP kinase
MPIRLQPRGILIAFEGIDGAGKSTHAAHLEASLRERDLTVVRTKEPTNGPWGRVLRASAATGRLSPADELHAFLEDRREHVSTLILPELEAGSAVIVDRYYFSTVAYQGARGHDPVELLRANEAFAPVPDLLVLLEIDVDEAVARITRRDERGNLFEKRDDLVKSAAIFATLSGLPYLLRIDGTEPREEVSARILEAACALPQLRAAGVTA